jgi:hypothetical protein
MHSQPDAFPAPYPSPQSGSVAHAHSLYERFRPEIPSGKAGWGAKGELDLRLIRSLAAGG